MEKTIIFHVETTGLCDDRQDEILELAIINYEGETLFHELFKPRRITEWKDAEEVNQISPEMVKDKKYITEHRKEILDILLNADEYILYNPDFDIHFIVDELELTPEEIKVFFSKKVINVMREFACEYDEIDYRGDYISQGLLTAADYYDYYVDDNEEVDRRALSDCITTLFVYKKLLDE